MLNATAPDSMTVQYYFGGVRTAKMYAGDRTADLKAARDGQAEANATTDVDALRALHAAAKHAGAPAATLAHIVARGTALAAPATNKEATA